MHLNASWKGEIQPVLPSDNLQIHLIWLIFASILIISKTTLAEVLLSTCPVSEHRLQYSARNQSFIVFREGFLLTLLLWPWDWADAMLFGFEQGLGTESWRIGVQGAAASKAKFPVSFWVLHSQVVLMHSLSMLHEGLCPPQATWILSLAMTFLLVLAELRYPVSFIYTKITWSSAAILYFISGGHLPMWYFQLTSAK